MWGAGPVLFGGFAECGALHRTVHLCQGRISACVSYFDADLFNTETLIGSGKIKFKVYIEKDKCYKCLF